jgi:hypothetical protein
MPFVLDHDWTLVTRNAYDFRGPLQAPGSKGEYKAVEIHAGLVCLNAGDMDLALQLELFGYALEAIDRDGDLVN